MGMGKAVGKIFPTEFLNTKEEVSTPRVKVLSLFLSTGITVRCLETLCVFRLAETMVGVPAGTVTGW